MIPIWLLNLARYHVQETPASIPSSFACCSSFSRADAFLLAVGHFSRAFVVDVYRTSTLIGFPQPAHQGFLRPIFHDWGSREEKKTISYNNKMPNIETHESRLLKSCDYSEIKSQSTDTGSTIPKSLAKAAWGWQSRNSCVVNCLASFSGNSNRSNRSNWEFCLFRFFPRPR